MIGHTWLAALFAVSVLACLTDRGTYNLWYRRILDSKVLRSIGRYSYGMYVIHFPIFLWLQKHSAVFTRTFGRYAPLLFVAAVGVSAYCLAVVSYHLVEKHFLRLKRYFVPRHDGGPNVAVAPNVA
jgi:peptidoglycan/LPS O-acetylase OafA/YrhL